MDPMTVADYLAELEYEIQRPVALGQESDDQEGRQMKHLRCIRELLGLTIDPREADPKPG